MLAISTLIFLIAIIQAYRSYPQLAPTRQETMATMLRDMDNAYITSELTSMIRQSSGVRRATLFTMLAVHGS